ncbi:MAG: MATE family efflux transporter [Ruminococcaceae bacterium]|nr:MATE family efflux transporter [Oscillospiraceae bacterium]
MSKITDMTSGNPLKLMLSFAFPVILTNFGQQFYQIADAAIVGRGIGVDALAAVGCTDWPCWLIIWSMGVMTAGFATFVSRFFGMRDYEDMNRSIVISAVISGLIAVILTVTGLVIARPMLIYMGTPENILGDAVTYFSTMVCGTLIVSFYHLSASVLRAFGDGKTPLVAMAIAAVLNIFLDLLFAIALGWGVFGAALASVTAQLVSFVFCLIKILRIPCVKIDASALKWDMKLAWEIFRFGLPLVIQYIIIHLSGIIVQATVNTQGSGFIAGYTAVNKLYGLLECSAIALGNAFTTFSSQNYGAGNYKRVKKGVNYAILLALGASALLIAIVLPMNRLLPQLFMDSSQQGASQALDVASRYLIYMILGMPVLYLVYVHRNNLQAIGIASWSLISGIAEAAIRVVMAKPVFDALGSEVLYYIEPAAWLMAWLFVLAPYYWYQKKRLGV